MKTLTGTHRFIYRCRVCERAARALGKRQPIVARALDVAWTVTQEEYHDPPGSAQVYTRWGTYRYERHDAPTCAEGHRMRFTGAVRGRTRPEIRCGPRCTNAVGPSCDCSCGGRNHARGHLSSPVGDAE